MDILVELLVKGMFGQSGSIPQNDEFHAGPRDGHVHTAQIVQETNLSVFVGPYQTDEDDVAFLPLETVHRIDGNQGTVGLEERIFLDQLAEYCTCALYGEISPTSMRSSRKRSRPIFVMYSFNCPMDSSASGLLMRP